jgi:hypothetical protein
MTNEEIEIRLTELSNDLWSGIYETKKCFGEAYRQAFKRLENAGAKRVPEKSPEDEQVEEDFLCFSLRSFPLKITRENAMKILALGLP